MILLILLTDYRWFITHTNNTEKVEGAIRSVPSGGKMYPELQWEYLNINITQCTTDDR